MKTPEAGPAGPANDFPSKNTTKKKRNDFLKVFKEARRFQEDVLPRPEGAAGRAAGDGALVSLLALWSRMSDNLGHQQIADTAGVSVRTASRTLRKWSERGFIYYEASLVKGRLSIVALDPNWRDQMSTDSCPPNGSVGSAMVRVRSAKSTPSVRQQDGEYTRRFSRYRKVKRFRPVWRAASRGHRCRSWGG